MTETPVSRHVHACVRVLSNELVVRTRGMSENAVYVPDEEAFQAVFELAVARWDENTEQDPLFREGYELCLLDVVETIAKTWGVALPQIRRT